MLVGLKKFEFNISKNSEAEEEDFPYHDGGKVIFERRDFIDETVSLTLKKSGRKFRSYYWRAPFGSGKTVFLKLMGRALASRGCEVYMLSCSSKLQDYHDYYFNDLAERAGEKTVVLLIDEVHKNESQKHWVDLLKSRKPANLLVLGVGVARLQFDSPQFDVKYPKGVDFPMFFTADDLPEMIAHFSSKMVMPDPHPEHIVTEICKSVLAYTSGHPFPCVKFLEHLLDPSNKIDLENIDTYMASEKFSTSENYEMVKQRCFSSLTDGDNIDKAVRALKRNATDGDITNLEKLGLWNVNLDYFTSSLVVSVLFRMHRPRRDEGGGKMLEVDESQEVPYAQQVISAGLRDMKEEDFVDAHFNIAARENAVGFQWGFNVKACLPSVWIAPQPRAVNIEHTDRGPKPHIDFVFNGRLNMGVELALNVDMTSLTEHLKRFEDKYKRYHRTGVVFHLDTKNDSPTVPKWEGKRPLYTFLKKSNELYCDSRRVQSNVSKFLPSPPARSYSTCAAGLLKNALKRIK